MFEPTDEQIEAIAKHEFETSSRNEWSTAHDLEQRDFKDWAREATASPAFQAIIRAAQAEALREAVAEFENHISITEFDAVSRRDGVAWRGIDIAWEYQGPYMDWLRNRADGIESADV